MTKKHKTMLAELRRASGKTQSQIADELGISKATYSTWETGRSDISTDMLCALSDCLGCTPNDILGYYKDSKVEPLSAEEREYLKLLQQLPPNIRADILDIARYSVKRTR